MNNLAINTDIAQKAMDMNNPNPQNNLSSGESALQEYCKYVDNLVEFGIFTAEKGVQIKQNLMKEHEPKPQETGLLNMQGVQNTLAAAAQAPAGAQEAGFAEFLKEQPEFFAQRENLKKYLEIVGVELDKEEFAKIATLIQELENAAIKRFAENSEHGQTLKEYNELAKNRLKTLSSSVSGGKLDVNKVFSPREIGAMTSKEFKANEKAINAQIANKRF